MLKYFLTTISLMCALMISAQEKTETFYKDYYMTKEVDVKKAQYKKVTTKNDVGLIQILAYNLTKNCIIKEELYKDNMPVGVWKTYDDNCALDDVRDFSKLVYSDKAADSMFNAANCPDTAGNFEMARFGDSENAIFQYLASNIQYPSEAQEAGISGKVYLRFIIQADGTTQMVSIIRSAHTFLDYEAWDTIENMPKWHPAKKDGQPVKSCYVLPVHFSLQ